MRETPEVLTVKDVMAGSKRGENRVRNAANSGALKALPRQLNCRMFFTAEAVADWIAQGSPEFPPVVHIESHQRKKTPRRAA